MNSRLKFLCALLLSHISINNCLNDSELVKFTLLHNNDLHARFEQISATLSTCSEYLEEANDCYGGFARTAHKIRELRANAIENGRPIIYLFAGDSFTGTNWFTEFGWEICSRFMNLLSPDAMTLGNHEFDEGLEGLKNYVGAVNSTTVVANLEFPIPLNTQPSKILFVNGTKIGVIGVLTPETKLLGEVPEGVNFKDEITVINEEASKLKQENVEIIIALTHSGYEKDKVIAKTCPEVDIVVGGHSHSFLSNGNVDQKHPETNNIEGPYPTVIQQNSGKKVPVVQAYANSKYIGQLDLVFTKTGDLVEYKGSPILLNSSIPQDQDVLDLLNEYRKNLKQDDNEIIGRSNVQLDGANECKEAECNLGNLITDAIVYHRVKTLSAMKNYSHFTDSSIAFINAGGIRSSIDKKPGGAIKISDIKLVLQFADKYKLVEVTGGTIRKALEHSASEYGANNAAGGILQMSGIRVVYNIARSVGNRVEKVTVLCAACDIPKYYPLDDTKLYNILVSDYLYKGGGGYQFREDGKDTKEPVDLEKNYTEYVIEYIRDRKIIYPLLEGRIVFL